MPNYDFDKDLPIAKQTELEIADYIEATYPDLAFISSNDDWKYDLLFRCTDDCEMGKKGQLVTFEIKEDFTCQKTGNVGLEYECRGKPSGISRSLANYYIYRIHTPNGIKHVIMKSSDLKQAIANKDFFRIVVGGDKGSNSKNYLFKLDKFLSIGKPL